MICVMKEHCTCHGDNDRVSDGVVLYPGAFLPLRVFMRFAAISNAVMQQKQLTCCEAPRETNPNDMY